MPQTAAFPPTEPLGRQHDRGAFSCGREELDRYLKESARRHQERNVAVCWVLPGDENPAEIRGCYSLSAYSVRLNDLPAATARKLPRYPTVPAALLGRLAVAQKFQRQRIGEHLMVDAMRRSLEHSQQLGIHALFVDALDERAASYYLPYGFIPLPSVPLRLFLPMATIESLFI